MSSPRRWTIDYNAHVKGFTEAQEAKLREAIFLLEQIVNSDHFRRELLARRGMNEAQGMSNQQIYDLIISGRDLYAAADGDFDLLLEQKDLSRYGFVAASVDSSLLMYIDAQSVESNDIGAVAGALMHEAMHKIGFFHKVRYQGFMTQTVPYVVGRLVHDIAYRYFGTPTRPLHW